MPAGHASHSVTAGSGPAPGFTPRGIGALMSLNLGRSNRRRRIESTRSQFVTDGTTREGQEIEMTGCHQAGAPGSAKEASSLREDDVSI